MSEIMSKSRDMMFDFYKKQPELGEELSPLENTEAFEKISLLSELGKFLPEGERSKLAQLVAMAMYSRRQATDGVKETAAGAYLAEMFGDPTYDRDILDKTAPIFDGIIKDIGAARRQAEQWLREADFSLEDLANEIERSILPVMLIRIQEVENKKKRFEASRKNLEGSRDAGQTAEDSLSRLREAHDEEIAKMNEKELKETTEAFGAWFELAQSLRIQQGALYSANMPDPMAVSERLVFSGSGGAALQ